MHQPFDVIHRYVVILSLLPFRKVICKFVIFAAHNLHNPTMNNPGKGTSSKHRHQRGRMASSLGMLPSQPPSEIDIITCTQDMSPIDSFGYGNPYKQTYELKEHTQHPDAALHHNNSTQQTTSTNTSVTLLSYEKTNATVPSTTHEIQQQSNAVLCTNSKQAISLLFDQRPKKSKQQIALEEQLDELYGESDDEDLLNEFKKRRDEGTLPIKRKCENTHEYPSQQVSTCPSQQNLNNRFIPPPKTINSRAPSSMISSISSSTSAGSKLYILPNKSTITSNVVPNNKTA